MKSIALSLCLLLGASISMAGAKKASAFAEDFNQMIQENQKTEAQLRAQLQEKAGIHLSADKPGTVAREKLEQSRQEPEQVIVNSSRPLWQEKKGLSGGGALDKSEMKRLSQEVKDAGR